ncbi:hypothetical protein SB6408_03218 [Klebsiella spallanzanii]|uniref:Uncharacterized protein n=1 Tax=Klebsiella spallanzanii TaxID=2587528 RepID=A0A564HWI1_9ENTR|nr:hypothetical protein SB6408_03218 [Klebsiella spallanzanii]
MTDITELEAKGQAFMAMAQFAAGQLKIWRWRSLPLVS